MRHRASRRLVVGLVLVACACGRPQDDPGRPDSASAAPAPPQDAAVTMPPGGWLVGPSRAEDLLDSSVSEASLRQRFGEAQVRAESIYVGEGFSEYGTVLFPGDSTRRLEILWQDTLGRRRPGSVRVRAASAGWRVYPGVGIGTDLRTIESLNGRAFILAGFGWDYSGTALSWEGGWLDTLWTDGRGAGRGVLLRLDPGRQEGMAQYEEEVAGDRDFLSSHRAMQALNPRVYEIIVRPR